MYEHDGKKMNWRDALGEEHPPKESIAEANKTKDGAMKIDWYGPHTFGLAKDVWGVRPGSNVFKPAATFMHPHEDDNPCAYRDDYSEAICTIM